MNPARLALALALGLALLLAGLAPAGAKKLALVIGNDSYANVPALRKARADAAAYRELLAAQGFDVTLGTDVPGREMTVILAGFYDRIAEGDTVAFVYAGHGWSDGAQNFLVPVDIRGEGSETLVAAESFPLRNGVNGILDQIAARKPRLTLAVIDACRNNPFRPPPGTRSLGLARGLISVAAPAGTFIAFSAGEGQTALDRLSNEDPDPNSVFTRHFLAELRKGGDIQSAFKATQVRVAEVAAAANHAQRPAYYDEVTGLACLSDDCATAPLPDPDRAARDWEAVKGTTSAEALERFIAAHPGSVHEALARERLAALRAPAKVALRTPPAPKREEASPAPRLIVVDAAGGGDVTTIAEAVAIAKAGTRIEVRPGRYTGGVDVSQPIEIVGVGDRRAIVWEAKDDDVIRWAAPSGRIANLTLIQGGGPFSAVWFDNGSATLEESDLTSRGNAVVSVKGRAAPFIRNNAIHHGRLGGIFLYDDAKGRIEGNDIYANLGSGIAIVRGADPLVTKNRLRSGSDIGIFVFEAGRGRIEGNEIFSNARTGIAIMSGGDPVVTGNRIRSNGWVGIAVSEKGRGRIAENEIVANAKAGILVDSAGAPIVERNRIERHSAGIMISETGAGTYLGNDLRGNTDYTLLNLARRGVTLDGNIEK